MSSARITGVGVVSAAGTGVDNLRHALREGRSAIGPLSFAAEAELAFNQAGVVRDVPEDSDDPVMQRLDRVSRFALLAAREAVADAKLDIMPAMRVGVIVGSGGGGLGALDSGYQAVFLQKRKRPHPLTVPRTMTSAPVSAICGEWRISGPAFAVSSACASANHALAMAKMLLDANACDVVIAGGSEAPLTFGHMKAWDALRAVSSDTCRPFSKNRSGLILAEGAGMFVLERSEHAERRGAQAWATLSGCGMSSGGADITKPDVDSIVAAMQRALEDAGLSAAGIDYINAHGTGTALNDSAEVAAIHHVFGKRALPVSSTKSIVGHAIGASGGIELAATLIGMRDGFLPPTLNYAEPDPACDVDVVPNQARMQRFRTALSNSFAFGDLNCTLVIEA